QVVMHVEFHFGRHTDYGSLSQRSQRIQTLTDHWRHTGTFNRVMGATARGLFDRLDDILSFAIQGMACPKFHRQFEPTVMDIDGENLSAPRYFCSHDCAQPYGATAINGNTGAKFRFQSVEYRTCAGLDAAAQRTH